MQRMEMPKPGDWVIGAPRVAVPNHGVSGICLRVNQDETFELLCSGGLNHCFSRGSLDVLDDDELTNRLPLALGIREILNG